MVGSERRKSAWRRKIYMKDASCESEENGNGHVYIRVRPEFESNLPSNGWVLEVAYLGVDVMLIHNSYWISLYCY